MAVFLGVLQLIGEVAYGFSLVIAIREIGHIVSFCNSAANPNVLAIAPIQVDSVHLASFTAPLVAVGDGHSSPLSKMEMPGLSFVRFSAHIRCF